jgi:hypothetical protein
VTTYGLTSTGFVAKTQDVIRGEINASLQLAFGPSIDLSDSSLLGQIVGILSEREGLLWDLAQQVNASQDPNQAVTAALDAIAALTGTFRTAASSSLVTLTLTGTPTTVIAAASQAKTASTGQLFVTLASATIGSLSAWGAATAYVIGDRRTNAARCYQCTIAGTSAGSGGPTTTASAIVDGTVTWTYLGDGTGAVDAAAASLSTGPIVAVSGDLTVIQTPVGGWSSVRNLLDAFPGADQMSDSALRQLRLAELSAAGVSTQDAIRSELLQTLGVTSATVFVNNTDTTNVDSMPPHSVEALVQGGVDQDVLNTMFASVAAGIAFQGTTVGTVVDSQGTSQTVAFSRPAQVAIYVDVSLIKDPTAYAGDAAVQAAIVAYGQVQLTGKDAVANSIMAAVFGVAGVLDVTQVLIHFAPIGVATAWAPTTAYTAFSSFVTNDGRTYVCITSGTSAASGGPSTTSADFTDGTAHWRCLAASIFISSRQLAVHDTSRIAVRSTDGTP